MSTNIYRSHYLNMCFQNHFKLLFKIAIATFKINILKFKWSAFASSDKHCYIAILTEGTKGITKGNGILQKKRFMQENDLIILNQLYQEQTCSCISISYVFPNLLSGCQWIV